MANNISSYHPSVIAAEALRHLEDKFVITNMCAKDVTSEFSSRSNGWKVGDTVSFRTHGDYEAKEFSSAIEIQDISTSKRSMSIEKHYDVSVQVTSREDALDLDSFSEQVLRPASYRLAEKVELYVASKLVMGNPDSATGAGGGAGLYLSNSLFASAADVALARKAANLQQLDMNRFALLDPTMEATLLGQSWFNQAQTRGAAGLSTLQSGILGTVMGIDWYSSINFPSVAAHTAGTAAVSTDNGAGGNTNNRIGSSTLVCDALDGTGVVAGDRIAIAGVRRPLIVKTSAAATATSITLVDPISEIIPDNAAMTIIGTGTPYTINGAIFDNRSLAVAFPMLDIPGDKVAGVASNNGVSIRVVKGFDMSSKKTTLSLDLLCGAFCHDPRRITLLGEY